MASARARGLPVIVFLAALSVAAVGLSQAPEADVDAVLEEARRELTSIEEAIAPAEADTALTALRARALDLQERLQTVRERLEPQLAETEARLAELGPVPDDVASESPDIAAQREQLETARRMLNDQARLAALLAVEAQQTAAAIAMQRRSQFQARLGARTAPPLGTAFWAALRSDLAVDRGRARVFLAELRAALASSSALAWLAALAAATGILVLRARAQRWLLRMLFTAIALDRLRRSLIALGRIVLWVAAAVTIAYAIELAFGSAAELVPRISAAVSDLLLIGVYGAYVAALGTALVSAAQPSWRLPALSDEVAQTLRPLPLVLASLIALRSTVEVLAAAINLSLTTAVALTSATTLALGIALARALRRAAREHAAAVRKLPGNETAQMTAALPIWLAALVSAGWVLLVGSVVLVLLGYVALASFIVNQVTWAVVVVCTAYVLSRAVDDGLTSFAAAPRLTLEGAPEESPSARIRYAVLLSAVIRVLLVVTAVLLLLEPYGAGPTEVFGQMDRALAGIAIGEIQLRPVALLRAVLVLAIGMAAVRLGKSWLRSTFLPTTRMNAAMRDYSVSLFGYAGYVVVAVLALSAIGVAVGRIGWIVSALAVGIGFGLQSIVQNFVSGLILLTEGKIRVGDWVVLGDVEGDVRRIDVRATEIQRGDRSTIIVPNSELITKVVRNVTYENSLGLIQIRVPVPRSMDPARAAEFIREAFEANEDVLRTPAPTVHLESIDPANATFSAMGFARSPRTAQATRSAVLFDVLERLNAAAKAPTPPGP